MTRRLERDDERLAASEGAARPEPAPPEPEILALQRGAGNAAVTRMLQRDALKMRKPDLNVHADADTPAYDAVSSWFVGVANEVRQRESGSPLQSLAELVHIAAQLTYTDDAGNTATVGERIKPAKLEPWIKDAAKHAGIVLLEHRSMSDVRGVQAEAMAILANLDRIPTEATFGGDENQITVSITGKVKANVGALKITGEPDPDGGYKGKASIKGRVGDVEVHGSPKGVGGSVKTPGGTKVGVDMGKGLKAQVTAGDLVTVKGSVQPEGDGKLSWSAQITIGTLGDVITPADVAKVMAGAQETFSASGAALLEDHGVEGIAKHGDPLKKAVTDVADKARKSAAQAKPGWSVGVGVKGDKTGGYSGTVTFTWVF